MGDDETERKVVPIDEQRTAPRFKASFPVEVGPDGGLTIDLSSSGIAFESTRSYDLGEEVTMKLRVNRSDSPWPMSLECRGKVVRVQPKDDLFTIAATVEWIDDEVPEFAVE